MDYRIAIDVWHKRLKREQQPTWMIELPFKPEKKNQKKKIGRNLTWMFALPCKDDQKTMEQYLI